MRVVVGTWKSWSVPLRAGAVFAFGIVVWFVIGALGAQRACAHDPRFACSPRGPANPIAIPDPNKSWAFYGHLQPNQTDDYVMTLSRAANVPWNLLVDERDAQNPARPTAILTAPGGKVAKSSTLSGSHVFYEPFSRERYISSPQQVMHLDPGVYRIRVVMRGGTRSQRYTLAIGSEERFSVGEIPYVLGAIHRIRTLRY